MHKEHNSALFTVTITSNPESGGQIMKIRVTALRDEGLTFKTPGLFFLVIFAAQLSSEPGPYTGPRSCHCSVY